ncbi:MAG: hypothetical protein M3067_13955 [Chloroflexota bacterium]|nr:hypothetical protein [Chloroflexota bacterium]
MPIFSIPGAARPLVVVVGALVTLQSSQTLDLPKVAFFAVAILALAGSILHVWKGRDSGLTGPARPWLIASVIIAAIVGLSLPVAVANGTALGTWLRDAAPYALIAAAPWLALDLASAVSPRVITWATIIAGSAATVSFAINWVQRRHLVDLPLDRLVLPSFALATAFFALLVARSMRGSRDRYAWAVAAAVAIGLLLSTGTRTTLVLAAVPIVLLGDAVRVGGRSTLRTAFIPAVVPLVVVAVVLTPGVLRSLSGPPPVPLATAPTTLATAPTTSVGGSNLPVGPSADVRPPPSRDQTPGPPPVRTPTPTPVPDPGRFGTIDAVVAGSDVSLRLRWAQTVSAWNIFLSSPLVGRGLGVPIPWIDWDGTLVATFSADTPLTVLAKFGLMGIVIWVALAWATISTLRRLRRTGRPGAIPRAALLGFATGIIVLAPFGAQLEDKGTGLALILLVGLALAVIRSSEREGVSLQAHA